MLYLFDLDDTLIEGFYRKDGPNHPFERVVPLPGRHDMLDALERIGHTIAVCTNQGGVAFGFQTEEQVYEKLHRVRRVFNRPSLFILAAFSHPEVKKGFVLDSAWDSWMRKPNPGMLETAARTFGYNHRDTMFVGDRPEDQGAATRFGCAFHWADGFFETRVAVA